MADILAEDVLTLAEAAKTLPCRRMGRPTHATTLLRWSTGGIRGVKLETIQIGSTRCTSREALHRFVDRVTEAAAKSPRGAANA